MEFDTHARRKAVDQAHALVVNFDDPFAALTDLQSIALRLEAFAKGELYQEAIAAGTTVEVEGVPAVLPGTQIANWDGGLAIKHSEGAGQFANAAASTGNLLNADPAPAAPEAQAEPAPEPAPVRAKAQRKPRKAPKARATRKPRGRGNGAGGEAETVSAADDTLPASVSELPPVTEAAGPEPQMAA